MRYSLRRDHYQSLGLSCDKGKSKILKLLIQHEYNNYKKTILFLLYLTNL